ncbi:MAG: hypothetical protein ACKOBA_01600, partial [Limnohabitans sp.]
LGSNLKSKRSRIFRRFQFICDSADRQRVVTLAGQTGTMRAQDHQFQQALVVGLMQRQGDAGVHFDVEGSGYGFRFIRQFTSEQAHMPHSCAMQRFKLPPQS